MMSILGMCNQFLFSGKGASYPFHLPSVSWWKDESLAVLLCEHHRHRHMKTVLTGLIAVIFKIPLSYTKPSVTHRWSVLVCRHGLCCHWKCQSCFGRSVVSFHQVMVRIVKFFTWRVSKAFVVHLLFCSVVMVKSMRDRHNYWIFGAEQLMVERDCSISAYCSCLLWHSYSLAAVLVLFSSRVSV